MNNTIRPYLTQKIPKNRETRERMGEILVLRGDEDLLIMLYANIYYDMIKQQEYRDNPIDDDDLFYCYYRAINYTVRKWKIGWETSIFTMIYTKVKRECIDLYRWGDRQDKKLEVAMEIEVENMQQREFDNL